MSAISQVSSQQSVSGRWVSNFSPSVSALSLRYYRHKHYHNIITGSLILHGMTETTLYRLTDADAVTIQKTSPRTEAHVSQQRSWGKHENRQLKIWLVQRSIVLGKLLLFPGDIGYVTASVQSLVYHNRRRRQEMSAHVRSEQLQLTGSAIRYQGGLRSHGGGWGATLIWCSRSGWEMLLHYSGSGLRRCESYLTNLP